MDGLGDVEQAVTGTEGAVAWLLGGFVLEEGQGPTDWTLTACWTGCVLL